MKKFTLLILMATCLYQPNLPVLAQEDNPATQCVQGVELFFDGDLVSAYPLLEAGFNSRDIATFSDPNDLGGCALALGFIRNNKGDRYGALEAYAVSLNIFQQTGEHQLEGITLNNIGEIYNSQGRYEEALIIYEEALTVFHEVDYRGGEGITLSNIGTVHYMLGRYKEALISFEEALFISREIGDRVSEGATRNNIGKVYTAQGRYKEALITFDEALSISREVDDRTGEGVTLNNIAEVYKVQGRYEEALTKCEEALSINREVGNRVGEGATLNNIAEVFYAKGWYQEALASYEEVLYISREVGDRVGEGMTLNGTAAIYHIQGRYAEALTIYEQALAIVREIGNRANEGIILNNMAGVYDAQGMYEKALTTYDEALAISNEVGDLFNTGSILNGIAKVYKSQGMYKEALTSYEGALAIRREVDDRAGAGVTLNGIAATYYAQGKYEEALSIFEEALAIFREVGNRVEEGITLNNIAAVYNVQGKYEEALSIFEEALAIFHEVGSQAGTGITLNSIGIIYHNQGQNLEAIQYYAQAVAVIESIRTLAGNDLARASFINQHVHIYHNLLDLYVEQESFSEAFLVSEQGRARSFGDALATGSVQLVDGETTLLIEAESDSYNTVIATQDALIRARTLDPPDPTLVADLEAQLVEAQAAHDEALTAIEAQQDQLTTLVPSRQAIITLPETQALLSEQTTLVSFWVLEERVIAFILTHDSFDVVPLNVDENTLNTQVKAFHDFPDADSTYPAAAVTLYDSLISPLRSYLNTSQLIIVPHQALHYIPFAALTDGERYLLDDYTITYLPSASMLRFLPTTGAAPVYDTALILGDPSAAAADDFGSLLSPLPGASDAAQQIAALFGSTPLLGEAATEATVRQNVTNANILHLGAHTTFNTVAPLQSAIYLTPGTDAGDVGNDGRLHVDEVYDLPMDNVELVVLSACQTNVGNLTLEGDAISNITAGDELVSLNRAFLFQSPTVISTLWTVDDAAAGLLVEQFYTYLLDGKTKADALRLAQIDVRKQYPNPYFWAGFILSGSGGNVEKSNGTSPITPDIGMASESLTSPEAADDSQIWVDSQRRISALILFTIQKAASLWVDYKFYIVLIVMALMILASIWHHLQDNIQARNILLLLWIVPSIYLYHITSSPPENLENNERFWDTTQCSRHEDSLSIANILGGYFGTWYVNVMQGQSREFHRFAAMEGILNCVDKAGITLEGEVLDKDEPDIDLIIERVENDIESLHGIHAKIMFRLGMADKMLQFLETTSTTDDAELQRASLSFAYFEFRDVADALVEINPNQDILNKQDELEQDFELLSEKHSSAEFELLLNDLTNWFSQISEFIRKTQSLPDESQ